MLLLRDAVAVKGAGLGTSELLSVIIAGFFYSDNWFPLGFAGAVFIFM